MSRQLIQDVGERAALTFLQAFLGVWLVADWADLTDVRLAQRAAVAGVAAALAVIKGFAASRIGDGTASLLPRQDG
jgi:hypothetical protein